MRLLVLGGSWFVGRHLVETAAGAGHDVTVFNRGRTPATYPEGVALIQGDRTVPGDLARLAEQGPWDGVVDVPETPPAVVEASAQALGDVVGRYVVVSSVSAYVRWPSEPVTETSDLCRWDPDDPTLIGAYGPGKVGGEEAVRHVVGAERALAVRPGVVIGPGEYVGRIPWWLSRMARGGRVLAPGRPDRGIQPLDVRDLATFILHLLASAASGPFNVAAPMDAATYGELLEACAAAVGADVEPVWIDEDFLVAHGVRQWTELPLWRTAAGTWAMDTGKARAAGLATRPLQDTVRDVQSWLSRGGRPVEHDRWHDHGIDPGREAHLIAAWDRRGT